MSYKPRSLLLIVGVILGLFFQPKQAWCEIRPFSDEDAIRVIITEASGEPFEGMVAVGEVLRTRSSLKGFYGYQRPDIEQFIKRQGKTTYNMAKRAWKLSETSNYSHHATHFESTRFKRPYWAQGMKEVAHIGHHVFYKKA